MIKTSIFIYLTTQSRKCYWLKLIHLQPGPFKASFCLSANWSLSQVGQQFGCLNRRNRIDSSPSRYNRLYLTHHSRADF